jgi:hypothetical protein
MPAAWGAETNAPAPVARQIRDILSMSTEEARQRHPVAVQAVVTFFYPSYDLWFVQDQTGGIFVTAKSVPSALKPGDGLTLGGSTMAGLFSPILYATSVQKIGPGVGFDLQWEETKGFPLRARLALIPLDQGCIRFTLQSNTNSWQRHLQPFGALLTSFVAAGAGP